MLSQRWSLMMSLNSFLETKVGPGFSMMERMSSRLTVLCFKRVGLRLLFNKKRAGYILGLIFARQLA